MASRLALIEAASLFAGMFGALLVGGATAAGDGQGMSVLGPAAVVLALCCLAAFYLNDLYDLRIVRGFREFAPRLVQSMGLVFIPVGLWVALSPGVRRVDELLVAGLVTIAGLVIGVRALFYGVVGSALFQERVLLVGAGPLTTALLREVESQPSRRWRVIGVVDDEDLDGKDAERYPLLGPLARLDKIIDELGPDRVIVGLRERRGRLAVAQLLEPRVRGIRIEDGSAVYEELTGKLAIEALTPSTLVFSSDFRQSRLDLALARGLSLAVAALGLAVTWPLLLGLALAIKLESRGPVLFLHERVGLNGRRFRLIKFRTMHPVDGATSEWARDNGDRITRVGRVLRRYRLDELPQFVNILRGDLNLVGPRPHPATNVGLFAERIPYYSVRSLVRPGVTGWAQVHFGYANDLGEETEKMRYDLYYIKHMSIGLDLWILFHTVKIVLFGRGGV
jgi:exopolysaccharide biosynthesis polyprenyl glycosylphosphotransferase